MIKMSSYNYYKSTYMADVYKGKPAATYVLNEQNEKGWLRDFEAWPYKVKTKNMHFTVRSVPDVPLRVVR